MLQVWLRRWLVGVWLWYDRLRWQSLLHAFATWSAAAAIAPTIATLALPKASTPVAVAVACASLALPVATTSINLASSTSPLTTIALAATAISPPTPIANAAIDPE